MLLNCQTSKAFVIQTFMHVSKFKMQVEKCLDCNFIEFHDGKQKSNECKYAMNKLR